MSSEPPSGIPPITPAPAAAPPRPIFNANGQPMPALVNLDPNAEATRPRTAQEAERYFRRIALERQPPSNMMRWLSIGGWVAGACKYTLVLFCPSDGRPLLFPFMGSLCNGQPVVPESCCSLHKVGNCAVRPLVVSRYIIPIYLCR